MKFSLTVLFLFSFFMMTFSLERGTLLVQTGVAASTGWGNTGMLILKDIYKDRSDTLVRTPVNGSCFSPDARKVAYMDDQKIIYTMDIFTRQVRTYNIPGGGGHFGHVLSWANDGIYITKGRYVIRMDTADASLDTVYRVKLTPIISTIDTNKIDLTQGGVSFDGKHGAYTIVVDNSGSLNHAWSLNFETGEEVIMNDGSTSASGGKLSCQAAISTDGAFVGHTNYAHNTGYIKYFTQNMPPYRLTGGSGFWFFRFPRNSLQHAIFRTSSDSITYLWNFEADMRAPLTSKSIGVYDAFMGGWLLDTLAPASPTGLAAQTRDRSVLLTWVKSQAGADGDTATRYIIVRNGITLGESPVCSFVDKTVIPDSHYTYRVYAGDDGVGRSAPSELAVTTPVDHTPPRIVAAYSIQDSTQIRLVFSEPLDSAVAVQAGHYSVLPSVSITSAKLLRANEVLLTTASFTTVRNYQVSATGIADKQTPANLSANDSFPLFVLRGTVLSTNRKPVWSLVMADSANSPDDAQYEKWPAIIPQKYQCLDYLKAYYADLAYPDTQQYVRFYTNRKAEITIISSAGLKYCRWLSGWTDEGVSFAGGSVFSKIVDSGLFAANGSGWPKGLDKSSNLYLIRAYEDTARPVSPGGTAKEVAGATRLMPEFSAYPNPFHSQSVIKLAFPSGRAPTQLSVQIFDTRGRLAKTLFSGQHASGTPTFLFHLQKQDNLRSGIYFCRIKTPGYSRTLRLLSIR